MKTFASSIFLIFLFALCPLANAQELSRWALGRPSLLIDLPGEPRAAGVAWAEKPLYSVFPNSWAAEGGGVRVEVARIYGGKTPEELLTEIARKMNAPLTNSAKGVVSGREFVSFSDRTRMVAVIGGDSSLSTSAAWALSATYQTEAGFRFAGEIFGSVLVEREGGRNWALRSLGRTYLVGELPFELTEYRKAGETDRYRRYETHFDGMDVEVLHQTPGENAVFNVDDTVRGLIEGNRSRPGVTDFRSSVTRTKLGDKTAELITMDFKQGYRNYRFYDVAHIEKNQATIATIKIDPTRADHLKAAERILRSLRSSNTIVYGWKTQAVGSRGLYMDLPKAPDPPKQQGAVSVYSVDSGLAMVEIRELQVDFPTAHDPDFTAKNYFELQNAIGKTKFDLVGIEKRLIDGLEARLIKATWRNGEHTNQRQILMILGYETRWIIDVLAAKETVNYLERVLQSVRVQVPPQKNFRRQSFGKMGVSFLSGEKEIPVRALEIANNADISHETSAFTNDENGMFLVHEIILKNNDLITLSEQNAMLLAGSLLRGISEGAGITITPVLRESFPVNIDGVEGVHAVMNLKASNNTSDIPVQGDFLMLKQGNQLWTLFVVTNYKDGFQAQRNRARILNSLRAGM